MAIQHLVKRYTLPETPELQQISALENEILCSLRLPEPLTLKEIAMKVNRSLGSVKAMMEKMAKKNLVVEFQPAVSQVQAA